MAKKSRKNRIKHKTGIRRKPLPVKEPAQVAQVLPSATKQIPVVKSSTTTAEPTERHRYILSDVRRSLTIAGVLIALLIILKFLLG